MKNILIVGCGFAGRTALTEAVSKGIKIDIITPEEAKERGLTITTNTEPPLPYKLTHVAPLETLFSEPQTRKDRGKQKRAKRKKRK